LSHLGIPGAGTNDINVHNDYEIEQTQSRFKNSSDDGNVDCQFISLLLKYPK
jgi:hypothetical protein